MIFWVKIERILNTGVEAVGIKFKNLRKIVTYRLEYATINEVK